jgi:hypothetical protein
VRLLYGLVELRFGFRLIILCTSHCFSFKGPS